MKNLKLLREQKNMSQSQIGEIFHASQNTVSQWENGKRKPSYDIIEEIANFFNVSVDYLLGREEHTSMDYLSGYSNEHRKTDSYIDLTKYNIKPIKKQRIPLLGEIACGKPIYADEKRESYVECGTDIRADFCLRAKGDSMINARIKDGDIVFIREQPVVENGQIAAVIIDDEATLKRVYFYPEKQKLILTAENAAYEPFVYIGDELSSIRILGLAVAFQSDVI